MYFSDIYADRDLPQEVRNHKVLWGKAQIEPYNNHALKIIYYLTANRKILTKSVLFKWIKS